MRAFTNSLLHWRLASFAPDPMQMLVTSGAMVPECAELEATRTPLRYSRVVVPSSVAAMCTQVFMSAVLDGPVTQSRAQKR
jgi:hypothetical protein